MTPTPRRFDPSEPGTGEPTWLTAPQWGSVPSIDLGELVARHPAVLVLSAHPDDETLGVGATIASLAGAGARIEVVVATAGDASHPDTPQWEPDVLATIRRAEVDGAVADLAPGSRVHHLGLPDGRLAQHETEAAAAIAARLTPETFVLAPWCDDGHPDHDALGRLASRLAAEHGATCAHYPIWWWHWAMPRDAPWPLVHAVEPGGCALQRKRAALSRFPSQTAPLGPRPCDGPVVTEPVLRRARRVLETLFVEPGTVPVRRPRDDADVAAPFDAMLATGDDPWRVRDSFYERRKRALTLAALRQQRYRRVLDVGCSTGVLTRDLAALADAVTAVDASAPALDVARTGAPAWVEWLAGRAQGALPAGPFDLVVFSEVGYFLQPLELVTTLASMRRALAPGGELLLVHWQHPTRDVPLDGRLVHEQAETILADLPHTGHYLDADLRLDGWGGPESIAALEGRG